MYHIQSSDLRPAPSTRLVAQSAEPLHHPSDDDSQWQCLINIGARIGLTSEIDSDPHSAVAGLTSEIGVLTLP